MWKSMATAKNLTYIVARAIARVILPPAREKSFNEKASNLRRLLHIPVPVFFPGKVVRTSSL